jgi:hypothetical protein
MRNSKDKECSWNQNLKQTEREMGEKDGSCLTIREPNIPYSIINQDAATIRCFLTTLLKHSVTDQGEKNTIQRRFICLTVHNIN